jgi:predicted nuclease with TOPRIM domain
MVLLTLLDIGIKTTVWTVSGLYSVGKYMIYGHTKTKEEEMEERIAEILNNEQKLLSNLEEMKKELDDIHAQKVQSLRKSI